MNKLAAQWILQAEGGFVDNQNDPGGLTNFGISQAAFPDVDIRALTPEKAIDIYQLHYWEPARCPALVPALALVHFDESVNSGVGQAILLLQRAVGVTADGQFGPQTLAACQRAGAAAVPAYMAEREAFYTRLVRINPVDAEFLDGWENRLNNLQAFLDAHYPAMAAAA